MQQAIADRTRATTSDDVTSALDRRREVFIGIAADNWIQAFRSAGLRVGDAEGLKVGTTLVAMGLILLTERTNPVVVMAAAPETIAEDLVKAGIRRPLVAQVVEWKKLGASTYPAIAKHANASLRKKQRDHDARAHIVNMLCVL